mmetsp:Transcript_114297/g.334172  ORF Transcript_114297/g.334172 Transcript_114297/m.334172 type:complete len:254 (-) Transcript_114297:25-786(-)
MDVVRVRLVAQARDDAGHPGVGLGLDLQPLADPVLASHRLPAQRDQLQVRQHRGVVRGIPDHCTRDVREHYPLVGAGAHADVVRARLGSVRVDPAPCPSARSFGALDLVRWWRRRRSNHGGRGLRQRHARGGGRGPVPGHRGAVVDRPVVVHAAAGVPRGAPAPGQRLAARAVVGLDFGSHFGVDAHARAILQGPDMLLQGLGQVVVLLVHGRLLQNPQMVEATLSQHHSNLPLQLLGHVVVLLLHGFLLRGL